MSNRTRRWILAGCLVAAVGCRRSSDANATREMPKLPPPPTVAVAPLRIEVEIDGKLAKPIDADVLHATKADFEDSEHRAWRLATLIGSAANRPGAVAEVSGDKGVGLVFHAPRRDGEPILVLTETRRGTIAAAVVDPGDPFPPYHGQGRRMSRPGDPLPRVNGVTKIRAYVEEAGGPAR
jgi:hypothetical protein